jgi:hypothetical protein
MGYGLMVTLVPLTDLARAKSSGDDQLLARAQGTRCDETVAYALARIIDGSVEKRSEADRALASAYGYATQRLCETLGEQLSNEGLYPANIDALRAIDEVLRARGVTFGIADLALGGPLLGLPEPDDYPMSGVLGADALVAAELREQDTPPPPYAAVWRTLRAWSARAQLAREQYPDGRWAVVGFYY